MYIYIYICAYIYIYIHITYIYIYIHTQPYGARNKIHDNIECGVVAHVGYQLDSWGTIVELTIRFRKLTNYTIRTNT